MSPIGVLGSKVRVAKDLIALMPEEAYGECYLELFAGGAGVFFEKEGAKINVINDLDPDITVMYEAIQRDHRAVEAELRTLLDNDDLFENAKQLRESEAWYSLPEARRAAMLIYIYKESVNSNQSALSSSSHSRSSFNPRLALEGFAKKLERAQIRHFHWAKALDVYLYRSPSVDAMVFADPPYVISDSQMHYRFNFHPIEHIRFWHRMTLLSKDNGPKRNVKILITYDDVPPIRSLYRKSDGWHITPLAIGYNSAHDPMRCRSEIAITNYEPPREAVVPKPLVVEADWSDVPADRITLGGKIPFSKMRCCDKERAAMLIKGVRKSECRVCGEKIKLPVV